MNLLELIPAFEAFALVLVAWMSVKDAKNQRHKNAIDAIGTAADETSVYLSESENRKNADRNKEIHLASLWRQAYLELKEFDPELAKRCRIKTGYWQEPSKWREKDIAEAQIRLTTILREVDRLMSN